MIESKTPPVLREKHLLMNFPIRPIGIWRIAYCHAYIPSNTISDFPSESCYNKIQDIRRPKSTWCVQDTDDIVVLLFKKYKWTWAVCDDDNDDGDDEIDQKGSSIKTQLRKLRV